MSKLKEKKEALVKKMEGKKGRGSLNSPEKPRFGEQLTEGKNEHNRS